MSWHAAVRGLERYGIASRDMGWTCDRCGATHAYRGYGAPPHAPKGWGSAAREVGDDGFVMRRWHVCARCVKEDGEA